MNIRDYFKFVRWYFNYIGDIYFDNDPPHSITSRKLMRKERLPYAVFSYVLLLLSLVSFLFFSFSELYYGYFLSIAIMIGAISGLIIVRFSFIYYLILYVKLSSKDRSVNDKVIAEHCILLNYPTDITKMISKYCHIYGARGNAFSLKLDLGAKSRKNRKKFNTKVLRITPNKIYLDKKEVFSSKLYNMSALEKFFQSEKEKAKSDPDNAFWN